MYYSYGSELTCEEKGPLVLLINDVEIFKTNYQISQNYSGYMPLVYELHDGNFLAENMV